MSLPVDCFIRSDWIDAAFGDVIRSSLLGNEVASAIEPSHDVQRYLVIL